MFFRGVNGDGEVIFDGDNGEMKRLGEGMVRKWCCWGISGGVGAVGEVGVMGGLGPCWGGVGGQSLSVEGGGSEVVEDDVVMFVHLFADCSGKIRTNWKKVPFGPQWVGLLLECFASIGVFFIAISIVVVVLAGGWTYL